MYRHALLNARWYLVSLIVATGCTLVTFGPLIAVVGTATSLLIAFVDINASPLLFLGSISYSLYLIHVPIGGRLINATVRFSLGPAMIAAATVVTLGVSILAATVFYRLVEKPAKQLAFSIQIRKRSTSTYLNEVDAYSLTSS
jgi:peptidoglycan/LPS O-acetylase OafA/YrhL